MTSNALTVCRTDVVAALRAGLAGVLPDYRVLEVKPSKPAAPQMWLGPFGMNPDTVGDGAIPVVALTGTVVAVVDGDTGPAVIATDLLQAAIWQALDAIATPTSSAVGTLDVGGPTLYAVTVTFQAVVGMSALCPLELFTVTST